MTLRNIEHKKRNKIISAAATAGTASFTHVSHCQRPEQTPDNCLDQWSTETGTVAGLLQRRRGNGDISRPPRPLDTLQACTAVTPLRVQNKIKI